LPGLRPLIGKRVEIVVNEEESTASEPPHDYSALAAIAGQDLVDPEARRPAVQQGEAETNVIDMGGDGRLSGHGPLRRRTRVDRVELAKQTGVAGVEHICLLPRRALKDLPQHVGQRALKDGVGGHRFS
jgi:hypothetical protein